MKQIQIRDLPTFAFPVVAWGPPGATGEDDDDGTRQFRTPVDVATTYFPAGDLREGYSFVDAEGRCWEAVSSRVTGTVGAPLVWLVPRWLVTRKYWLEYKFAERPPMTFDVVKSHLHAALTANPQLAPDYIACKRAELRWAESLHDVVGLGFIVPETKSLWWQWAFVEGRCSRAGYVLAAVATGLGARAAFFLAPRPGLLVASVILCGWISISAVFRRLHDLGRSAIWIAPWAMWTMLCAISHDNAGETVSALTGAAWQLTTAGALVFLAVWPGTKGDNAFGAAGKPARP